MSRAPLVADSHRFSASCRQRLQRRNSVSPSMYLPESLSSLRSVLASVNDATGTPAAVNRNSGSAVRFPMTVMGVCPIAMIVFSSWIRWLLLRSRGLTDTAGQCPDQVRGLGHGQLDVVAVFDHHGDAGRLVGTPEPALQPDIDIRR